MKLLPFLLFILTSLVPLFWMPRALQYQYLGTGDYYFPVQVNTEFHRTLFSIYDSAPYGGIDKSERLPELFFYWPIMWISQHFSLPTAAGTLLYIVCLIYVAQLLAFIWLRHTLPSIKFQTILSLFGGIVYAYSPYLTIYVEPGQMANYMFYAFFPGILLFVQKLLSTPKIMFLDIWVLFGLFTIFTGGASYAIGPLYCGISAIGLYTCISLFIDHHQLLTKVKRGITIISILIAANIYWILPWIFNGLNQAHKFASPSITNGIRVASYYASFPNILLGKAGGFTHLQGFPHIPITILYITFTFGLFMGFVILWRNKRFLTLTGLFLASSFIIKGTNGPLPSIFLWSYSHIPGFSVFRRPINKFSGVYLTCFITLGLWGLLAFMERFPKYKKISLGILIFVLGLGSIGSIGAFMQGKNLTPFSTPAYYEEAWKYLSEDHVTRVMVVPGLNGVSPYFNSKSFGGYYGYDPLYKLWDTSVVFPDFTDYSPNLPLKPVVNSLLLTLAKTGSFCEYTKKTAVSHILVRDDLNSQANFELSAAEYKKIITGSKDWQKERYFGNVGQGISVFSITPACRSSIITATTQNRHSVPITVTRINSVKYLVSFPKTSDSTTLQFLTNYSPWWRVFPVWGTKTNWIQDMLLIFPGLFIDNHHHKLYEWANVWEINTANNSSFLIYYLPQSAVYLGMITWGLSAIGICMYCLLNQINLWKQK